MKPASIKRIRIMFGAMALFALLLVVRLYMIQIVSGDDYSERADRQYTRPSHTLFNRGSIFFQYRDGRLIPAASLNFGFIVSINPKLIPDPEQTYKLISAVATVDKDSFMEKASKTHSSYQEILKRSDEETALALQSLKIPGLQVYRERWRHYPGDFMAAHALGFVAYNEDELDGRYGLERFYEDILKREYSPAFSNFFAEIFSNIQDRGESSKLEGDLITTIEPTVQAFVEEVVRDTQELWGSKQTGAIVIDPTNGEIYAMAMTPTFNPNQLQNESSSLVFSNPLVENVYEMGSIIKPLTVAAGIDMGVITPQSTYYDAGFVTLNGYTMSNYDKKGRGLVDMQTALNNSLNTGMVHIMQLMKKENFARYMLAYGIADKTGIDLPNESAGLADNLSSRREVEYATASFGQGIALTPIAVTRALSVLSNGGTLITPHLVRQINYKIGVTKEIQSLPGTRVISQKSSEEITRMLVNTYDTALLGGKVKMDRYSIAAKTGTAQIAKTIGRGYEDSKYLHSFFGYFPAYDAKFLVFLFTIEPQKVNYASETLTLPFVDITKFLINYYEVSPDR